jgi:hypothetical protein
VLTQAKMIPTTKTLWKTMCIIRDSILENNGFIFGGFVRDMILHDHNAINYYETANDATASIFYDDKNVIPETWDRTLIPTDIDIVIDTENFEKLKMNLRTQRLRVKVQKIIHGEDYQVGFEIPHGNTVTHYIATVELDTSTLFRELKKLPVDTRIIQETIIEKMQKPCIKIDILMTSLPVEDPFFGLLDYECNGLYLSKSGICLAKQLIERPDYFKRQLKIQQVIEDIIHKKAVFLRTTAGEGTRCVKLYNKGWKICDKTITTVKDATYEGHCIICHGDLPENHMKLNCCDCRYHAKCLENYIDHKDGEVDECILCKSQVNLTNEHQRLLSCMAIYGFV